jgi:flagellar P-ring protein precursor FlgI
MTVAKQLWPILGLVLALTSQAPAARVKELATIAGVRDNLLLGYGLVVGLRGTGDRQQTIFSTQTLSNVLEKMGVSVPPATLRVNNVAAVLVTATLPPYAVPGSRIDVVVNSIGDAGSLQGGTLLLTPLKASTGVVFAAAQGPVSTGGFAAGRGGADVQVNHPTVGRIPGGALVERPAPTEAPDAGGVSLLLRQPDFTTAARVAEAVNQRFEGAVARAENAGLVRVAVPVAFRGRPVEFIAALEPVEVRSDRPARVVLNERTGTVVIGKDVRIAPVAVLHGNLTIQIVTAFEVSHPGPLSPGQTVVAPQTSVTAREEKARHVLLRDGVSVEELIRSLVAIGSTPRDVIAIMQSIARAGALEAELEVI